MYITLQPSGIKYLLNSHHYQIICRKYHVIGCKTIKWKNNNLLSPYADTQPLHT